MAVQTKKASFAAKTGQQGKAAAAAAAKSAVDYGNRELPAGINNGTALLIDCQLQELEAKTGFKQLDGSSAAGELMLVLVASVESPEIHQYNGTTIKIKGRQFRKWCPLFRKGARGDFGADWDFDECVKHAGDEMRKIGGEEFDVSNLDSAITALANAKPKPGFLFSTVMGKESKKIDPKTGKPFPPRLNTYWNGATESVEAPNPSAGVQDETGADASGNDAPLFDEMSSDLGAMAELVDGAASDDLQDENSEAFKAAEILGKAATDAGMTEEEIGKFASWGKILEHMQGLNVVEEVKEWGKGDECNYAPPAKGPGGKERPGKAVECKIVAISRDKKKADIVTAADAKKGWKGIPIDALTRLE